jgi:hypothetical protein
MQTLKGINMDTFYIVEADGIILPRTISRTESVTMTFYEEELKTHRYNRICLKKYECSEIIKTTDEQEAQQHSIKIDKFKKIKNETIKK